MVSYTASLEEQTIVAKNLPEQVSNRYMDNPVGEIRAAVADIGEPVIIARINQKPFSQLHARKQAYAYVRVFIGQGRKYIRCAREVYRVGYLPVSYGAADAVGKIRPSAQIDGIHRTLNLPAHLRCDLP